MADGPDTGLTNTTPTTATPIGFESLTALTDALDTLAHVSSSLGRKEKARGKPVRRERQRKTEVKDRLGTNRRQKANLTSVYDVEAHSTPLARNLTLKRVYDQAVLRYQKIMQYMYYRRYRDDDKAEYPYHLPRYNPGPPADFDSTFIDENWHLESVLMEHVGEHADRINSAVLDYMYKRDGDFHIKKDDVSLFELFYNRPGRRIDRRSTFDDEYIGIVRDMPEEPIQTSGILPGTTLGRVETWAERVSLGDEDRRAKCLKTVLTRYWRQEWGSENKTPFQALHAALSFRLVSHDDIVDSVLSSVPGADVYWPPGDLDFVDPENMNGKMDLKGIVSLMEITTALLPISIYRIQRECFTEMFQFCQGNFGHRPSLVKKKISTFKEQACQFTRIQGYALQQPGDMRDRRGHHFIGEVELKTDDPARTRALSAAREIMKGMEDALDALFEWKLYRIALLCVALVRTNFMPVKLDSAARIDAEFGKILASEDVEDKIRAMLAGRGRPLAPLGLHLMCTVLGLPMMGGFSDFSLAASQKSTHDIPEEGMPFFRAEGVFPEFLANLQEVSDEAFAADRANSGIFGSRERFIDTVLRSSTKNSPGTVGKITIVPERPLRVKGLRTVVKDIKVSSAHAWYGVTGRKAFDGSLIVSSTPENARNAGSRRQIPAKARTIAPVNRAMQNFYIAYGAMCAAVPRGKLRLNGYADISLARCSSLVQRTTGQGIDTMWAIAFLSGMMNWLLSAADVSAFDEALAQIYQIAQGMTAGNGYRNAAYPDDITGEGHDLPFMSDTLPGDVPTQFKRDYGKGFRFGVFYKFGTDDAGKVLIQELNMQPSGVGDTAAGNTNVHMAVAKTVAKRVFEATTAIGRPVILRMLLILGDDTVYAYETPDGLSIKEEARLGKLVADIQEATYLEHAMEVNPLKTAFSRSFTSYLAMYGCNGMVVQPSTGLTEMERPSNGNPIEMVIDSWARKAQQFNMRGGCYDAIVLGGAFGKCLLPSEEYGMFVFPAASILHQSKLTVSTSTFFVNPAIRAVAEGRRINFHKFESASASAKNFVDDVRRQVVSGRASITSKYATPTGEVVYSGTPDGVGLRAEMLDGARVRRSTVAAVPASTKGAYHHKPWVEAVPIDTKPLTSFITRTGIEVSIDGVRKGKITPAEDFLSRNITITILDTHVSKLAAPRMCPFDMSYEVSVLHQYFDLHVGPERRPLERLDAILRRARISSEVTSSMVVETLRWKPHREREAYYDYWGLTAYARDINTIIARGINALDLAADAQGAKGGFIGGILDFDMDRIIDIDRVGVTKRIVTSLLAPYVLERLMKGLTNRIKVETTTAFVMFATGGDVLAE